MTTTDDPDTQTASVPVDDLPTVDSVAELREIIGEPHQLVIDKVHPTLNANDREWLLASPLCFISTSDADGNCDVSPKGDPVGQLVHIIDDGTIAIAERAGNRRADGYLNILQNPHVGLVFVVPGRSDTVRVNGRARLVRDAPWFDELIVQNKRPILALVIEIEEVFLHCARSFVRSQVWHPETWPDPDGVVAATREARPSRSRTPRSVEETTEAIGDLERRQVESYGGQLY